MQLRDYLELKGQTLTDFAVEVGARMGKGDAETLRADEAKLNAIVVRVSRHVNAVRVPDAEMVTLYDELTKGAVTAQDWVTLALIKRRAEPPGPPVAVTAR